jgi:MFS family permease
MQIALPAVLREEPRYRLLFAGQILSLIGDRITFIALPFAVLAIGDLSDLAIVTAALSLPFLVVAIPAGTIADRFGRRETMIAADAGRAVVQAVMATLLLTGTAEIWMLAVLAGLFGIGESFFGPAMVGLIPQTVETARLQQANALFGLVQNAGMVIGPALAGVLIALTGTGQAIAIDSLTFVVSALCLSRLRSADLTVADGGQDGPHGILEGLRTGWVIVRDSGWLLPGIGALVAYTVFVLPSIFVLGPVLAEQSLNGASSWAIITTAFGIGAVAGSVLAYRVRFERTLVACFGAMLVACSQGAILASGLGVPGIAACEAAAGIGVSLFFTLWDLTVQQQVPPEATARVSAYDWAAAAGLMPIGLLISGPIAATIGLETTMRAGTVIGVVAALACLSVPAVRRVRRPPEVEADYAEASAVEA